MKLFSRFWSERINNTTDPYAQPYMNKQTKPIRFKSLVVFFFYFCGNGMLTHIVTLS